MTGWFMLLVAAGALGSTGVVMLAASRVRRLDRLHRRLDAARAALDAALQRRARVAAALPGVRLPAAGPGRDREVAANALSRLLAGVDRAAVPAAVRAELADAEELLVLARRVHNDAVRDTLGLRSLRMVRWLHLAGTAPMPAYFEIADPPQLGAIAATAVGPAA